MNRKILIICIATIFMATIGIAIAAEDIHEDMGVEYNVPEGYSFEGAYQAVGFNDIIEDDEGACFEYKKGADEVSVTVFNVKSSVSDKDFKDSIFDSKEKTIAGQEGLVQDLGDNIIFNYLDNGKYIYITAPDESIIEEMLK